jgi:DNA-binding NarL/FixJ family response regulator
MNSTEFYITPKGDVMLHGNSTKQLQFSDRAFVSEMLRTIHEFYPEALAALSNVFEKIRSMPAVYEFNIVRRFIKCSWGKFDSVLDIDQFGNLNFEEVECPLRGECPYEGIVCKPKFNSNLSEREKEVMSLLYRNLNHEEIAEKLFISADTVKTHKRNAFRRVNVHSLAEFFIYAKQNHLFEN